jgi:thioredoxin reductase (NADPH)
MAGGQVKTTHQVANYPGFVDPIAGHELARNMRDQAARFGTRFELAAEILNIQLDGSEKMVTIDNTSYSAQNIILATGSSPRLLNVPGEIEFKGSGVSYCATCDGEFYKDKDVTVIGGGNSAMEESLLLLQMVKSLTVIHQFDELQAEKITANKVLSNPKTKILWSHEPRKFIKSGQKMVTRAENLKTKEIVTLESDGIFIFAGMVPNTTLIKNTSLNLSEQGYILANENMETNISGVYAAGDVRVKKFRQITTAISDGTIAALNIIQKR